MRVCAQPVDELEREMNSTYSKFLSETAKRELRCDMVDPKTYDPFERK